MERDEAFAQLDVCLGIGSNGLRQAGQEPPLPSLNRSISGTKLLMQGTPAKRLRRGQVMEAERQPHIEVEGCARVGQLPDCSVLKRHRVLPQLVIKIRVEQHAVLKQAPLLVLLRRARILEK